MGRIMNKFFLLILTGFFCLGISYAQGSQDGQPPLNKIIPKVSVNINQTIFTEDQTVVLTINNQSGEPIVYRSGCSLDVCRYSLNDKEWRCEGKKCYGAKLTLQSGQSIQMKPYINRGGAKSFKCRFKYQGQEDKIERVAFSDQFTVN